MSRHQDPRLPLWLRVALYACDHADPSGHVELRPLQLLWAIDPTGLTQIKHVSRAIRTAETYGALAPGSSARCLRLSPTWARTEVMA